MQWFDLYIALGLYNMRRFLALLLLLCVQEAIADQLYVFVGVTCTPKSVEVKFERGWNVAGEKLLAARVPNRWVNDELRLVASEDDVHYKTTPRPKTVHCRLGGTRVRVSIEPEFAHGWHPTGMCATRTGARVRIYRGAALLSNEGLDACTQPGEVPVSITVPAHGAANVTRMSAREFIDGP